MRSLGVDELDGGGILKRVVFRETPERIEYRLTERDWALGPVVAALSAWADEWLAHESRKGPSQEGRRRATTQSARA